ncbi:hypothetical protein H9P43_000275 [Blastocladiella emersonii ATCC 22665]|nr:hypothetical protein H9P43_000275 [Blastocladiella emersonii ATCC 22665]
MLQQISESVDMQSLETALAAVAVSEERIQELESLDAAQLRDLLRDAYATINKKERDLLLAAEIGQSLLDANNDLRLALSESEDSAPARAAARTRAHLAAAVGAGSGEADEVLAKLEAHNRDLEARVDSLEAELRESRAAHRRDAKQLAVELERERARAEALEARANDAQAAKEKLARDNIDLKVRLASGGDASADLAEFQDELLSLRGERDALAEANQQLALQLTVAATQADELKGELDESRKQVREFHDLQESWKYQARHIIELRDLVDEQRARIAKITGAADANATAGIAAIPTTRSSEIAVEKSQTSLISELEAAWVKEHGEPKTGFSGLIDSMRGLLQINLQ